MPTLSKAGYFTVSGPAGLKSEGDTQTCGHCGVVYVTGATNPDVQVDLGGHCRICDHSVCGPCCDKAQIHGCEPFMKKIEEMESRARFLSTVTDG